jgi:adenine-specific DNA methylase
MLKQTRLKEKTESKSKNFRSIHYLGSKLRILDFLETTINKIDPQKRPVCDLFAGSGNVASRLSDSRKVFAVDIQEYSRILCSALMPNKICKLKVSDFIEACLSSQHGNILNWCFEPLIIYEEIAIKMALNGKSEFLCDIIENGAIVLLKEAASDYKGTKKLKEATFKTLTRLKSKGLLSSKGSLISRYYGGVYFSYQQAVHIDIVLEQISKLKENQDIALASVLSSVSNIVNTIGKQFAQPIRPRTSAGIIKPNLGKTVQKDRSIYFFNEVKTWFERYSQIKPLSHKSTFYRMDYLDALKELPSEVKVIYADPPYTRDHYSRYYHVLETICLRDNPKLSTMVAGGKKQISRGLYREDRHQSPFCIKSMAPNAFTNLFDQVSKKKCVLILSYSPYDETKKSHPRLMKLDQLTQLAKIYFKKVEVISPGVFAHSKLNKTDLHLATLTNAEVLIVCTL